MSRSEEERFTTWWGELEPAVLAIGRRYLRTDEAAEDLAQDVAIAAFSQFGTFADASHFNGWTLTRARWLALDRLRLEQREIPVADAAQQNAAEHPGKSELAEVLEIISRFPHQQRVALLRTFEGFATAEIAKELRVSPATVRSLRRHARYRLLQALEA